MLILTAVVFMLASSFCLSHRSDPDRDSFYLDRYTSRFFFIYVEKTTLPLALGPVKQLLGLSAPSTGISRRSLPATTRSLAYERPCGTTCLHPRCDRYCHWHHAPSRGLDPPQTLLILHPLHPSHPSILPPFHPSILPSFPPFPSPTCSDGVPTSRHLPDVLPTRPCGSRGLGRPTRLSATL